MDHCDADDDRRPTLSETIGRVGGITLNRPQQLSALNDTLMNTLDKRKPEFTHR